MEEGQVDFLGYQLFVHQCYQVALESGHPANEGAHPEPSNARKQEQLLNLVKKDPSTIDPLQPLCLSHDIDQITYTSSLFT